MADLRWLHFSDLQVGRSDTPITIGSIRAELERDLRTLHTQCGPWDLVFLTGSLVADRRNPMSKGGSVPPLERSFGFLDSVLDSLWGYLQSLGSTPTMFALPGFGDMEPGLQDGSDPHQRWGAYSQWMQSWIARHPMPPWIHLQWGETRADWRAVAFRDSTRIGMVGLGSVVDPAAPATATNLPSLLQQVVGRPLSGWAAENDANLLILPRPFRAKHAPHTLMRSVLHGIGAIVCGQPATVPHERGFTTESLGFPTVLNPSMATLDGLGYSAGIAEVSSTHAKLRVWPRILVSSLRGGSVFVPAPFADQETGEWSAPMAERGEDDGLTAMGGGGMAAMLNVRSTDETSLESALASSAQPVRTFAQVPKMRREDAVAKRSVDIKPSIFKRLSHKSKPTPDARPLPEDMSSAPSGLIPTRTLTVPDGVLWMTVSQDRSRLAVLSGKTSVWVLDPRSGERVMAVPLPEGIGQDIAFSPDGMRLAVTTDRGLHLFSDNQVQNVITTDSPRAVVWESDESLLVGFRSGLVSRYNAQGEEQEPPLQLAPTTTTGGGVSSIAAHAGTGRVAVAQSAFRAATLTRYDKTNTPPPSLTLSAAVLDLSFSPDGTIVAIACDDGLIVVLDAATWTIRNTQRAHWDAVSGVYFSPNGKRMVSKGLDDRVVVWNTVDWQQLLELTEPADRRLWSNAVFVDDTLLITLRANNLGLRLWTIDTQALSGGDTPTTVEAVTSAKVVLLGEGRSGKSCLALRLAEGNYDPNIPSTHGMRIWRLKATQNTQSPREIILWDLGGQHEYRLIHPLFLRHTSVALLVMEPGRGQTSLAEVSGWDQMLCSRTDPTNKPIRFLVGTKIDDLFAPIEQQQIGRFVADYGYRQFFPTSAKTGVGCSELLDAVISAIDWEALGRSTRTMFEHTVRDYVDSLRRDGRVFVSMAEMEKRLQQQYPADFEATAVGAVVAELALCGLVWDTRLGDGTRVVILDVERIEQYAGTLVVCARENPRGVPAIEIGLLSSPDFPLPRLRKEERLPRDQELVILDITVQLILEQGLAFRTGGLLIFPSLFPTDEATRPPHHYAVPLYYEFSGAIDQVYATVVSSLANLRRFGAVRLYKNAAEFGLADGSVYGMARSPQQKGTSSFDRLDLYFSANTPDQQRAVFIQFVEEHLRELGVGVLERLEIHCPCGYRYDETVVRKRLEARVSDVLCPVCETRTPISFVSKGNGEREQVRAQVIALRQEVSELRRDAVRDTKFDMQAQRLAPAVDPGQQPTRILHLSDLHIFADTDPTAMLQPLATDLRDKVDGLGIETLDLLVISGDITNYGSAAEFQQALAFVSALVADFGLTAQRCLVVPGNHDLSWDHEVYEWRPARKVDLGSLPKGSYVTQGGGVLVRLEEAYPGRFTNFSEHFYHPLLQQPYPLAPSEQGIAAYFPQFKLQFLLLNTSVEIDEFHQSRSTMSPAALAKALQTADRQKKDAGQPDLLRMAVFHHPITGNEKIENDGFAEQLRKSDVRLALHGHVHEERHDLLAYLDPNRAMHCAGAGSFGAGAKERPPSVPRLYNLLEVAPDRKRLRIYTRSMRKDSGAWGGHTIWPGPDPHTKRSWVEFPL